MTENLGEAIDLMDDARNNPVIEQADGASAPVGAGSQLPTLEQVMLAHSEWLSVSGEELIAAARGREVRANTLAVERKQITKRLSQYFALLFQRLAELEKDAARLEFLLGEWATHEKDGETGEQRWRLDYDTRWTMDFRAAIDADMHELLRASSEGARAQ